MFVETKNISVQTSEFCNGQTKLLPYYFYLITVPHDDTQINIHFSLGKVENAYPRPLLLHCLQPVTILELYYLQSNNIYNTYSLYIIFKEF